MEGTIVSEIIAVVTQKEVRSIEKVVEIARASLPTLSIENRCIKNLTELVRMVNGSILAFDNVTVGIHAMWDLILSAPASLEEDELGLSHELDKIQNALQVCEVIEKYLPMPSLSILLKSQSNLLCSRYIE